MRVSFDSEVSKFLSAVTLILSFCFLGFVVWKAVDLWRADPTLKQIQELVEQKQN
jgi:hypothetical protein